jgi:TRAP-type uncharacterized transport system fused permease subunit
MSAALLPALLFFGTAFAVVQMQAIRNDITPVLTRSEDPRSTLRVVLDGGPFIAVFVLLIGMMLVGYSPFKASLWAMAALIICDNLVETSRRCSPVSQNCGGYR